MKNWRLQWKIADILGSGYWILILRTVLERPLNSTRTILTTQYNLPNNNLNKIDLKIDKWQFKDRFLRCWVLLNFLIIS
jgi:hypothetical protein